MTVAMSLAEILDLFSNYRFLYYIFPIETLL